MKYEKSIRLLSNNLDVFAENNYLYLHCYKVINPNTLPCVEIYTVLGHVSFPALAGE